MKTTKAFLVVNRCVEINKNLLIEGIFWKRKNARKYAQQLIEKTGALNYKFLYRIITYKFKEQSTADQGVI